MSDLENELLGLAEDDPYTSKKKRSEPKSKSKTKSKAYVEDSSGSEMDMDLESEEGEGDDDPKPAVSSKSKSKPVARTAKKGVSNPYPVEGKYLDEDDRDQLDAMPEFEREAILAARQEEMQKFKDSQQLDAMYRLAGMGGEDEAESEEEPSRKKRKHTSVSKEASRAIKDLKNKRKATDERAAKLVSAVGPIDAPSADAPPWALADLQAKRRDRTRRSDEDASSGSDEDGEISHSQTKMPSRDRAYSPDYSPTRAGSGKRSPKRQDVDKELDTMPASNVDLNSARLGRYDIVEMMYKDGFEDVAVGSYVRLGARELDERGQQKYRIHRIEEIQEGKGRYDIEYKGKNISEDRGLLVSYGKAKRLFRVADVSNGDVEAGEYDRFERTNRADGVKVSKRSELKRKNTAIREMLQRPMSDHEISRQVEARQRSNPVQQRHRMTIEITNLITSRNLAMRRNDAQLIEDLNRQIVALGGDPQTGELVTLDKGEAERLVSEYDDRIERINENNRRKVKDNLEKAHQGSLARKKAEEAIVREKQAKAAAAAKAAQIAADAEMARKEAEERGESLEEGTNVANGLNLEPISVELPSTGLKKGETPQQYIARTIDLDLGDF